jgi:hypothetical protein
MSACLSSISMYTYIYIYTGPQSERGGDV